MMKNPTLALVLCAASLATLGITPGQAKTTKTRPSSLVYRALDGTISRRSNCALKVTREAREREEAITAPGNALDQQALTLLIQGKLEDAERVCREAMAFWQTLNTTSTQGLELLGDIQLAQGKYEEALATYAIVRQNSDNVQTSISIAQCYLHLGDLEKSRKALQECPWTDLRKFAADPLPEELKDMPGTKDLKSMEATLMLALAIITPYGYEHKLKYLQAADKLTPDSWLITNRIGDTLYDLKRYEEAISYYRREMQIGGDKTPYHHRTRVEMYDLWQKQQKEKASHEQQAPN
jgi:tetratricopeptide (TPR) repeat protein